MDPPDSPNHLFGGECHAEVASANYSVASTTYPVVLRSVAPERVRSIRDQRTSQHCGYDSDGSGVQTFDALFNSFHPESS
jgi:hypothetical protein